MDDIVKVLVIMAAFALPLIRQIKKSKTERSAQKPFVPIPDTEEPEVLKVTRKYQPLHSQSTSQKVEVKKEQNSFSENRNDSGQRPGIYYSFG
ncbi:hypothetical protein NXW59_04695 [Bacteroides fragilis]|nr:hypothetical protein [Bacteroides fragilis]